MRLLEEVEISLIAQLSAEEDYRNTLFTDKMMTWREESPMLDYDSHNPLE